MNDQLLHKRQNIQWLLNAERLRQLDLQREGRFQYTCSDPELSPAERLAVLTEEVGEVARHVNDHTDHSVDCQSELIQVAAVCLAWLESYNNYERQDHGRVSLSDYGKINDQRT
jgi:NTP pyrophosphatase (non-canonical NTP hydrolase)